MAEGYLRVAMLLFLLGGVLATGEESGMERRSRDAVTHAYGAWNQCSEHGKEKDIRSPKYDIQEQFCRSVCHCSDIGMIGQQESNTHIEKTGICDDAELCYQGRSITENAHPPL